jgi:FKBP-type peptidyl-prolyl cis-trans isomerase
LLFQIKRTVKTDAVAAGPDDIVGIRYKLKLLDDRQCYTADSVLYREYHLSKDDMPAGLREGLLLMQEGDKALFIIPSHLAFGLSGDGDCIPPNAALVMTVTVKKITGSNRKAVN